MPIDRIICDRCGVTTEDFEADYDEQVYCRKCYLLTEIEQVKQQRAAKMLWLENTHLKDVREMDERIQHLERLSKEFEDRVKDLSIPNAADNLNAPGRDPMGL